MDELYQTNANMDEIAAMLNQIEPGSGAQDAPSHTHTEQTHINSDLNDDRLDISEILSFAHPHDDALTLMLKHSAADTQSTDNTHIYNLDTNIDTGSTEPIYTPAASSLSIVDALASFTDTHPTQYGLDYF